MARIAFLVPVDPRGPGGVERVVRESSSRLQGLHDVHIVCPSTSDLRFRLRGVEVHALKGHGDLRLAPAGYLAEILRLRPDVLYAHTFTSFVGPLAIAAKAKLPGSKLVFHPHYHPSGSTLLNSWFRLFYDYTLGQRIIRQSDLVLANSKSEGLEMRRRFWLAEPPTVIYNGVDVDSIRDSPLPRDNGRMNLLFVGRLVSYKRPLLAIRILKSLPTEYHLNIIGGGALGGKVRELIKSLGLECRVTFLQVVTDKELYSRYKEAKCHIGLSASESFGMTAIEALAAGTPSLVNDDHYGLSETANLFPHSILKMKMGSRNIPTIAERVKDVASLKPVSEDIQLFTWQRVSERLEDAFKKLCEAGMR